MNSIARSLVILGWLAACSKGADAPPPPPAEPATPVTNPATNPVTKVGVFEGPLGGPMRLPTRLVAGPDGLVFVSDPGLDRVWGFRSGVVDMVLTGLDRPLGVAVAGQRLLVGNAGRRNVELYDLTTRSLVGELADIGLPNALAVQGDDLYVADSHADQVLRFSLTDRRLLGRIGAPGSGPGELRFPAGVAVDADRVVVADQGNHRVQIFSRDGKFLQMFGAPIPELATVPGDHAGRFTRVQAVALIRDRIYVLDSFHGRVQAFDFEGQLVGGAGQRGRCASCFGLALDISRSARDSLLATDSDHGRWVELPAPL
ncbi:MAG: hypothetical protein HY791_13370 [Deltaproteobacteria bacterium]|nr:hypothetical protein [Deltaproteobacteria bacterium]